MDFTGKQCRDLTNRLFQLAGATFAGGTRTAGLIGGSVEGVHDDDAALHYEFDVAEEGDVREGIALDGDAVGELDAVDGAEVAKPSSGKDEMVSSMGECAEFKPGFLASLGMTGVVGAALQKAEGWRRKVAATSGKMRSASLPRSIEPMGRAQPAAAGAPTKREEGQKLSVAIWVARPAVPNGRRWNR